MRTEDAHACEPSTLTDLGAASALTQGTFMPLNYESVLVKDYFNDVP